MKVHGILFLLVVFDTSYTVVNGKSSDQGLSGLIKKLEVILVRLNNQAAKKVTMAPDVVKAVPSKPELGLVIANCSNFECPANNISAAARKNMDMMKKTFGGSSLIYPTWLCGMNITFLKYQLRAATIIERCAHLNMTTMSLNTDSLWSCALEAVRKIKEIPPAPVIWTSGQYAPTCDKYVWCPEKEVISQEAKWKKGYPKAGAGNCVAMQIGSKNPDDDGIFNSNCDANLLGFCVVKYP